MRRSAHTPARPRDTELRLGLASRDFGNARPFVSLATTSRTPLPLQPPSDKSPQAAAAAHRVCDGCPSGTSLLLQTARLLRGHGLLFSGLDGVGLRLLLRGLLVHRLRGFITHGFAFVAAVFSPPEMEVPPSAERLKCLNSSMAIADASEIRRALPTPSAPLTSAPAARRPPRSARRRPASST